MTDLSGMVEVVADAIISSRVRPEVAQREIDHARQFSTAVLREAERAAQAALTALTPHIEKLVEEARGGRVTVAEGELLRDLERLRFAAELHQAHAVEIDIPTLDRIRANLRPPGAHSIAPVDDAAACKAIRRQAFEEAAARADRYATWAKNSGDHKAAIVAGEVGAAIRTAAQKDTRIDG